MRSSFFTPPHPEPGNTPHHPAHPSSMHTPRHWKTPSPYSSHPPLNRLTIPAYTPDHSPGLTSSSRIGHSSIRRQKKNGWLRSWDRFRLPIPATLCSHRHRDRRPAPHQNHLSSHTVPATIAGRYDSWSSAHGNAPSATLDLSSPRSADCSRCCRLTHRLTSS